MKETGIIMSGNHPRLILDGTKTMTRRVITPQFTLPDTAGKPYLDGDGYLCVIRNRLEFDGWFFIADDKFKKIKCPYGQVGDRLWVRETWATHNLFDGVKPSNIPVGKPIFYCADGNPGWVDTWRPSLFMPRWASRITLEITEVRVERLQEISGVDCVREGIASIDPYRLRRVFRDIWDSLNAKRGYSWESNPWVWMISFKVVRNGE